MNVREDATTHRPAAGFQALSKLEAPRPAAGRQGVLKRLLTLLTLGQRSRRARTIWGWTPGLRRLVSTQCLTCGCSAGVYETWSSEIVAILDVRADCCQDGHATNSVLWIQPCNE